MLIISIK